MSEQGKEAEVRVRKSGNGSYLLWRTIAGDRSKRIPTSPAKVFAASPSGSIYSLWECLKELFELEAGE